MPLEYICKILNLDIVKYQDIIATSLKNEIFCVVDDQYNPHWLITPTAIDILEQIAIIKEDLEDSFEFDFRKRIAEELGIDTQFKVLNIGALNEN